MSKATLRCITSVKPDKVKVEAGAKVAPLWARLPFIRDDEKLGRCFWAVRTTGNYSHDCVLGVAMAQHALRHMREDTDRVYGMLGSIVIDMMAVGEDAVGRGVIVGFFGELDRAIPRRRAPQVFGNA